MLIPADDHTTSKAFAAALDRARQTDTLLVYPAGRFDKVRALVAEFAGPAAGAWMAEHFVPKADDRYMLAVPSDALPRGRGFWAMRVTTTRDRPYLAVVLMVDEVIVQKFEARVRALRDEAQRKPPKDE